MTLIVNVMVRHSLLSLSVGSRAVMEPTSVLHGDSVAGLGLVTAIALADNLLCDTHFD